MSDYSSLVNLRERLQNAKRKINRAVMSEMDRASDDVKMRMRELAPVDTGNLRDSITVRKEGSVYKIGPVNVDYAAAQEYGAKPHVIVASPGKVLAFKVGGETRFAKSVRHPGNKAQPYIRPAAQWAKENVPGRIKVVGIELLRDRK